MSINNVQPRDLPLSRRNRVGLLTPEQTKVTAALILVATGVVFFLAQSGIIDYGSPWWVIYIAMPGLALLWGALGTYQRTGTASGLASTQLVLGLIAIAVSFIFLVDPDWSFTHGWFNNIPIFGTINWNFVWPWLLVLPGAALVYRGARNRQVGLAIFGGILILLGGTFILNISWNALWPLVIVAAGIGLLFSNRRRS